MKLKQPAILSETTQAGCVIIEIVTQFENCRAAGKLLDNLVTTFKKKVCNNANHCVNNLKYYNF